ncbi:sensor domain-containing protein [Bacillus sp. FJAT-45350]|uniref:sensor domain-containing protein n=1 Tax=Bacillus sp. FJAT-45350 TaxID=2011014 RepID=UPI0015C821A4|nr:EAL domain-containing protein [Bacillus sp. FJAT-45350]
MLHNKIYKNKPYHYVKELYSLIEKQDCEHERSVNELIRNVVTLGDSLKAITQDYELLSETIDRSFVISATDLDGTIIYVNQAFCSVFNFSEEELIGSSHNIVNSGYHDKVFFGNVWHTILNGKVWTGEIKNKTKEGKHCWLNTTIIPYRDSNGNIIGFYSIRVNNTETHLRQALERDFKRTMRSLHNIVFKVVKDEVGNFVYTMFEGKLAVKLDLQTENTYGKTPYDIYTTEFADKLIDNYEKCFQGEEHSFHFHYKGHDLISILSPIYNESGTEVVELIGSANDITELKASERVVEYLAYHNSLTGLPNKEKLCLDFQSFCKDPRRKFFLYMIDLNRFKHVNDAFGHSVGDKLLKDVAKRLQEKTNISYIYHWGGDEFIFLVDYQNENDVTTYARSIDYLFKESFQVDDHEFFLSTSIGASVYPDNANDIDSLVKQSELAMYEAKEIQQDIQFVLYNEQIERNIKENSTLEHELRKALKTDEQILVYYQPKVAGKKRAIEGMEALVRWKHPERGLIPPLDFIPIAEETGLIHRLGDVVLRRACLDNKRLYDNGVELKVAVNISSLQFELPNFVEKIKQLLVETKLPSHLLELEITETYIMNDFEASIQKVKQLQQEGITITLDDFGAGYSSLSYLKKFSINKLKIDRSFVENIENDHQDKEIISAIITMAKALKIKTVVEGVETEEAYSYLTEKGSDEIQGYYISKPIDYQEFQLFLESYRTN